MPTCRYHLDDAKTPTVELDWNRQWKDMPVRVHGQTVGIIPDRAAMETGCRFDLATGETLFISLPRGTFVLPEVRLDGRQLYPPQQSPAARLRRATMVLFLIGGVHLIWGLLPLLDRAPLDQLPPARWVAVCAGALFLALGGLVKLRFLAAAIAALVLLVLSTAAALVTVVVRAAEQGISLFFVFGLVIQLGLLLAVYQGIGAIQALNRDREG
jgi:hypothetical protein